MSESESVLRSSRFRGDGIRARQSHSGQDVSFGILNRDGAGAVFRGSLMVLSHVPEHHADYATVGW